MNIDYAAIGRRIKHFRNKAGITQEALAHRLGLSVSHTSNIETARSKASLHTLVLIANVLGVTVDQLLCDNVISDKASILKEFAELFEDCTEYEIRLLYQIASASKDALRKNDMLAKFLSQSK